MRGPIGDKHRHEVWGRGRGGCRGIWGHGEINLHIPTPTSACVTDCRRGKAMQTKSVHPQLSRVGIYYTLYTIHYTLIHLYTYTLYTYIHLHLYTYISVSVYKCIVYKCISV